MGLVNLVFELLFGVPARNVLDTEVGAQIFGLLDKFHVYGLVLGGVGTSRGGVERARRAFSLD